MPTPTLPIFSTGPEPPWDELSSEAKFNRMGSWFLGNRGENAPIFQESMTSIIQNVQAGRQEIWPQDNATITAEMMQSPEFQSSVTYLQNCLEVLAGELSLSSVPFSSPRYAGHMSSDISLPAVLGYVLAQQYNQNNVSPEASPFTSYIEYIVGQQLCHMLGFTFQPDDPSSNEGTNNGTFAWGHITADGSIANLESIWIARNAKYYPLSLRMAMRENSALSFIASTFSVTLCTGSEKLFCDCTPWELLNLDPSTVASIPDQLYDRYNISSEALSDILKPFSIQTVGMEKLNAVFDITQPAQYMVSLANHYSWPKGCAIAGIGSGNLIEIGVDEDIRMDVTELEAHLEACLEKQQAVFCVVAVCGTTEHGSVDPVRAIVDLRRDFAAKGMSFMIHADAAWGGYFACKVRALARTPEPRKYYAFSIALNDWTNNQLGSLRYVDTITTDPHKSGYCPYPSGALCMRDGRFKFLTTWTSAYINTSGADHNMGIYGIEGSKPGAAGVAVLLSHEIVGLESHDQGGYANLLGTAMLTGIKMYGNWVTMDLVPDSRLVITPVNLLPVEREAGVTEDQILEQKQQILDKIVDRPNEELEADSEAMALLGKLGSDTMINAFACNFRVNVGGQVNDDVVTANFLNQRLYDRLSVRRTRDVINDRPIILNRTEFKANTYRGTLEAFKKRMKVKGPEDLVALSNVSMSPFPTAGEFLSGMFAEFREVAEQEITNCLVRIEERPSIHGFILQDLRTTSAHLIYLPMFHIKNQQRQLILQVSVQLESSQLDKITALGGSLLTVHTTSDTLDGLKTLDDILAKGSFLAAIYEGYPTVYSSDAAVVPDVRFTIDSVRVNESLSRDKLSARYPDATPFYLYAGADGRFNLDHVLTKAPNAQLSAAGVEIRLETSASLDPAQLYNVTLDDYMEWSMQPFSGPGFFVSGKELNVTVRRADDDSDVVGKGTLTLSSQLNVDYVFLNQEIAADVYIVASSNSANASDTVMTLANDLAKAFRAGDIEWTDNVVVSFGKYLENHGRPLPEGYSVTLGVPVSLPVDDVAFAVVSRFVCEQPSNARMQSLARGQAWANKLSVQK